MPDGVPSRITVLAGPIGAGKSSVAGRAVAEAGGAVFDPDEVARRLVSRAAAIGQAEADSIVWHEMVAQLKDAVARGRAFTFESTLGGTTIASILARATDAGTPVRVWYVALADAEAHVARVRRRVELGGHEVPEARVRQNYDRSRRNLAVLLPVLNELRVLDNSQEAAAGADACPEPFAVLHMRDGVIVDLCEEDKIPGWAAEIVAAARRSDAARRR